MQRLLTTREIANLLRMRTETVTRKAEQGLLPAIKIDGRWRIPQDRLDEWLKEKEQASPITRKGRMENPIKLKTYHMGEDYGTFSRKEIYEEGL